MRVHLLSTAVAPLDSRRALVEQRHTLARYGAVLTDWPRVLADSMGVHP